jgi:hypothetical protein
MLQQTCVRNFNFNFEFDDWQLVAYSRPQLWRKVLPQGLHDFSVQKYASLTVLGVTASEMVDD